MIDSRKLTDLHPLVMAKGELFLCRCKAAGIGVLIYSTYRDIEKQNALYAQGRTKPGRKVTNAKGGTSYHNFKLAFDAVPLRNGQPVWNANTPADKLLWSRMGAIGVECGLEWGGNWKGFVDMPHFQYTGGLSLAQLRAGKELSYA